MVGGGPPWCGLAHQRALPTCENLNLTSNITMSVVAEKREIDLNNKKISHNVGIYPILYYIVQTNA